MTLSLERQLAVPELVAPSHEQMLLWVETTLHAIDRQADELTVRITDEAEISELNEQYRAKKGTTNVLSFPFDGPPDIAGDMLGDVVICAPVVEREARQQGKPVEAHWAHMIVHGVLHLCGYDHMDDNQAQQMEGLEKTIMNNLGFADPYMEEIE